MKTEPFDRNGIHLSDDAIPAMVAPAAGGPSASGSPAGAEPVGEYGLRRRLDALGLTPRQQDVAALVVRGLPNKIIAARLAISEHTVKDHLKGIFGHLRLRRRSALTARVFGLEPEMR